MSKVFPITVSWDCDGVPNTIESGDIDLINKVTTMLVEAQIGNRPYKTVVKYIKTKR